MPFIWCQTNVSRVPKDATEIDKMVIAYWCENILKISWYYQSRTLWSIKSGTTLRLTSIEKVNSKESYPVEASNDRIKNESLDHHQCSYAFLDTTYLVLSTDSAKSINYFACIHLSKMELEGNIYLPKPQSTNLMNYEWVSYTVSLNKPNWSVVSL